VLGRTSLNGISEMVTMAAATVTTVVMNNVLVNIVGWQGVAAAGIVLAAQGIFMSLFFGYSSGVAPIVSYNYGERLKHDSAGANLVKLFRRSLVIVAALAAIALVLTQIFAPLLVRIFVSPMDSCLLEFYPYYLPAGMYDHVAEYCLPDLHAVASRGLRIAAFGYLFMGFNVFATSWFTAFNDGIVSGFLSLMRTMVFTLVLLLTLPRLWDLTGAWIALPAAEALALGLTIFFLRKMGSKYHYRDAIEQSVHT
jgi:Na+-driven multidrug efflux pump